MANVIPSFCVGRRRHRGLFCRFGFSTALSSPRGIDTTYLRRRCLDASNRVPVAANHALDHVLVISASVAQAV